jgi:hypothetical protein
MFWRVYILASESSEQCSLAEIQMSATAGGANLCTGGTASASSTAGPNVAANAFDGSTATVWSSALGSAPDGGSGGWDQWIQYEFATPVTIREVRLTSSPAVADSAPGAFTILSSADGITWIAHSRYFGQTGWALTETRTFAVSAAPIDLTVLPRLWLLDILSNAGGADLGLTEVYLATSAGGASIATGGQLNGTPANPALAFDGDTATVYVTVPGWKAGFLVYELPTGSDLYEVRIRNRTGTAASQAPGTFDIKSSVDGYHFTTRRSVVGSTGWGSGETRTFVL